MSSSRWKRALSVFTALAFFSAFTGGGQPARVEARVDPLVIIKRQIHKPNMLVVLDTSGSLTGVPGGTFTTSSEVGVDCDDGVNCRGGVSVGTCAASGKTCSTDSQCKESTCRRGMGQCTTNADCPAIAGTCDTGGSCGVSADCPPKSSGRCARDATDSCNPNTGNGCTSMMRCSRTGTTCTTASQCKPGICNGTTTQCNNDSECPYASSGGSCTVGSGSGPGGSCSMDSQCAARPKVCSDSPSTSCTTVADCGGTCVRAGTACRSNADCRTRNNDSCTFTGKSCAAPENRCLLPRLACNLVNSGNACQETNPCVRDPGTCTGAATDSCAAGVATDVCNATMSTMGSRMCRLSLQKCTRDSDCAASGDTCGPATSRFVIAKRVIRNVIAENANVVNFGLMTFFQDGYFPYYTIAGGSTVTKTAEIHTGALHANKCYSKRNGLSPTCTIKGVTYRLRAQNNTRYLVKGRPDEEGKYNDANYCGYFCELPGEGTGVFKGAYYEYQEIQGSANVLTEMPTYQGKTFTQGGVSYRYYDPRPDYYNGGPAPPIQTVSCGASCSATCGARWDEQLAPFLSTDDSEEVVDAMVDAFALAMEPASNGGLISYGGTPIGCTLENSAAPNKNRSAYHYMEEVKRRDPLDCRPNFVLLITDGEANGPGDSNCGSAACAAADPVAAGCTCRAVTSAYRLRKNLGVRTLVIGFSTDAATGPGKAANENIARAGGTDRGNDGVAPFSFGATSELELTEAIESAIYDAVQGSYSTAPSTASQGSQQGNVVRTGSYVLDSRMDFPTWKGHLIAYDITGAAPRVAWDAATKLEARDWKTRRVYTSDSYNQLVRLQADPSTGAITNKAQLFQLGLGATEEEAERIARWLLGDPAMKNQAILGAIVNSTPLDIAAPPESPLPGGTDFYNRVKNRVPLTYVGADDGMLHAFVTRTTTVGATVHEEGSEAFAYLPPSMLKKVSGLYAQGGQMADPNQHVFGLASSPKAKNLCVANCNDPRAAVWKTLLVMTEGWGGNGAFVLDVSDPLPRSGYGDPFRVMWQSRSVGDSSTYESHLGKTISVPAFMFVPSDSMDDHRVLMASGYPTADGLTQGKSMVMASVRDGRILGTTPITTAGSCSQEYTLLTDVAVSRLHIKNPEGVFDGRRKFLAGYIADTWGTLWRYNGDGRIWPALSLGCQHPLHFSPTVVQLDQDDPNNPPAGETYLVQVTNSTLDDVTAAYEPSKMVIVRELVNSEGNLDLDPTFGTGGRLELTSGDTRQLCAQTDSSGENCLLPLPANARPLGTPLAVPKQDGGGFLLLSHWYTPAAAGCGKGTTYFMMHELSGDNARLKQALKIADEPVTNSLIVGGKMMFTSAGGPVNIAGSITSTFVPTIVPSGQSGEMFMQTGWSEVQ